MIVQKLNNPPKSFEELAERNEIINHHNGSKISLLQVLGLAKWINQLYGKDESIRIFGSEDCKIKSSLTSKSWSDGYGLFLEGESDLVLSYTTSPAYHSLVEGNEDYISH